MFALLAKAFEGAEKLGKWNVQTVASTFVENQEITAKAFSAKDPQELRAAGEPGATRCRKAQSYWRQVYEIMFSSQAEFAATAALSPQKPAFPQRKRVHFIALARGSAVQCSITRDGLEQRSGRLSAPTMRV
jgi:phasin family protein